VKLLLDVALYPEGQYGAMSRRRTGKVVLVYCTVQGGQLDIKMEALRV
jgi:hypothetical protein